VTGTYWHDLDTGAVYDAMPTGRLVEPISKALADELRAREALYPAVQRRVRRIVKPTLWGMTIATDERLPVGTFRLAVDHKKEPRGNGKEPRGSQTHREVCDEHEPSKPQSDRRRARE